MQKRQRRKSTGDVGARARSPSLGVRKRHRFHEAAPSTRQQFIGCAHFLAKGLNPLGVSQSICLARVFAESLQVERREAWSAVLSRVRWE